MWFCQLNYSANVLQSFLHPLYSLYDWEYIVSLVTIDRTISFASLARESLIINSQPFTFRAFNHIKIFRAAGAVLTAISCTYRTTHTNGALRIDQQHHARNPHTTLIAVVMKSPSIALMTSAPMHENPKNPAKIVSIRQPRNPTILATKLFSLVVSMVMILR